MKVSKIQLLFLFLMIQESYAFADLHQKEHNIKHFNLSILAGAAFKTTNTQAGNGSYGPSLSYKASLAYRFENNLEVGTEIGLIGQSPTLGFDMNYYLPEHIFVGAEAALKINNGTYVYLGPKIGFDYHLTHDLTVGPELLYLLPLNSSMQILEPLLSVKYFP